MPLGSTSYSVHSIYIESLYMKTKYAPSQPSDWPTLLTASRPPSSQSACSASDRFGSFRHCSAMASTFNSDNSPSRQTLLSLSCVLSSCCSKVLTDYRTLGSSALTDPVICPPGTLLAPIVVATLATHLINNPRLTPEPLSGPNSSTTCRLLKSLNIFGYHATTEQLTAPRSSN